MQTQEIKQEEKPIELIINRIPSTRKAKREELIKEISEKIIKVFQSKDLLSFPREHINDLFVSLQLSERRKSDIVSKVLNLLVSKNLIKEDIVIKPIYSFQSKHLYSNDYNSYSLMMYKNGYKRYLYAREGTKKRKLATIGINETYPENLAFNLLNKEFCLVDESEIKSNVSKDRQGVYSMGNMSIVKDFKFYSTKKVYTIV